MYFSSFFTSTGSTPVSCNASCVAGYNVPPTPGLVSNPPSYLSVKASRSPCAVLFSLILKILQNMLDVPQFEIELWHRGHTRILPWYDEKLGKCNSNWGTSSMFLYYLKMSMKVLKVQSPAGEPEAEGAGCNFQSPAPTGNLRRLPFLFLRQKKRPSFSFASRKRGNLLFLSPVATCRILHYPLETSRRNIIWPSLCLDANFQHHIELQLLQL